ncbi:hypothetical protein ELH48_04305 [Rhizobium ruizarguesonis]|nr:hypothetical protein ELH48_04305 [Rhizobium ruizarguesonis]TBB43331.1 hypothetical protein ELH49_04295 [Rhizobium ruizarguesonis]
MAPIPGPSAIPSFLYDPSFADWPVSAGLLFDPRRATRNQPVPPRNKPRREFDSRTARSMIPSARYRIVRSPSLADAKRSISMAGS